MQFIFVVNDIFRSTSASARGFREVGPDSARPITPVAAFAARSPRQRLLRGTAKQRRSNWPRVPDTPDLKAGCSAVCRYARVSAFRVSRGATQGQRPDRWHSPIGADALPPCPSIVAHEQARIATCENGMRLCRMGAQRLYAAVERKRGAMPYPRLSGIWTVPYAPASRSQTYTVVRCHRVLLQQLDPVLGPRASARLDGIRSRLAVIA